MDPNLRPGSSLFPLLKTIFIDDVISKLEGAEGGEIPDLDDADLRDLRTLLYADDTVLVAASNSDFQSS